MKIGTVKEIKQGETRVGLTPFIVNKLTNLGHEVYIQKGAGIESGFLDNEYKEAGAMIKQKAKDIWREVELMVKVKEPQHSEIKYLNQNLTLFTYLHLASNKSLTESLLNSNGIFIAYETIEKDGKFPLLQPMSEIAGRVALDYGIWYLKHPQGIKKKFPEKVLIIGGGTVGESSAHAALGLGTDVVILEKNQDRRAYLYEKSIELIKSGNNLKILDSNEDNLTKHLRDSDIVIGSIYTSGAKANKVIKTSMLSYIQPGTVFVDVAIDQGGCFEFSRTTSIEKPAFKFFNNTITVCVPNMPATVGATATKKLCKATEPYILDYAEKGFDAVLNDLSFKKGVNIYKGYITCKPVAEVHGLINKYSSLEGILTKWYSEKNKNL